jgi:uncharacterized membrane protein YfcA
VETRLEIVDKMTVELIVPIVLLAFICELIDSSLGMGYGTTLTPLLLLLGYQPAEVVPAVLLSESVTGVLAALLHHEFGNVNLHPRTHAFRVTTVLIGLGLVGVLLAVGVAVNLPPWAVKLYIGGLVLGIGLAILKNHRRQIAFSWRRLLGLSFIAAFNKGLSGGGYGPVVTGGQVLAGVSVRSAVGIASLAEGVTSSVGVLAYLGSGAPVPWHLAPSLLLGAVLSAPVAAYVVSRLPAARLTLAMGSLSAILGGFTLARAIL